MVFTKEELWKFANRCLNLNRELLKRDEDSLSFEELYLFQITSYCLSIFHIIYENENNNHNLRVFTDRSLIEAVAVLKGYYQTGKDELSSQLIKHYNYLVDYGIYSNLKFRDFFDKKLYNYDEIKKNYEEIKNLYKFKIGCNTKEFRDLLTSKIPFIGKRVNFIDVIKDYLPEMEEFYHFLSVACHPNSLDSCYIEIEECNIENLERSLYSIINQIMVEDYGLDKIPNNLTMDMEINYLFQGDRTENKEYLSLNVEFCEKLNEVSKRCLKIESLKSKGYYLISLANYIYSIAIDKTYGYSEIVKCKFKPILELIATEYYNDQLMMNPNYEILKEIFRLHTKYCFNKIFDEEKANNYKAKALELIQNIDKSSVREDYQESFDFIMGFNIKFNSINEFVNDYIYNCSKNEMFNETIRLLYVEAQKFSHGNAYMRKSPDGAFMDDRSVIDIVDFLAIAQLKNFYSLIDNVKIISLKEKYELKQIKKYLKENILSMEIISSNKKIFEILNKHKKVDLV